MVANLGKAAEIDRTLLPLTLVLSLFFPPASFCCSAAHCGCVAICKGRKAGALVFRQLLSRMKRQQNQHHLQMRLHRSMNRDCNFKTINQHHDLKSFVVYYNSVIQALDVLGMVSEFVETQKVPLHVSVEDVWFWLTCLCTCTVEFIFSDSVAVQLHFLPVTLSRCHSI